MRSKYSLGDTMLRKIDPGVLCVRSPGHGTLYEFSDGSIARTEGRGRAFKIWCYAKEHK